MSVTTLTICAQFPSRRSNANALNIGCTCLTQQSENLRHSPEEIKRKPRFRTVVEVKSQTEESNFHTSRNAPQRFFRSFRYLLECLIGCPLSRRSSMRATVKPLRAEQAPSPITTIVQRECPRFHLVCDLPWLLDLSSSNRIVTWPKGLVKSVNHGFHTTPATIQTAEDPQTKNEPNRRPDRRSRVG